MSREEAIKDLTDLLPEEFLMGYAEAIEMGIEALERQCGDCISREEVVNKLDYLCDCLCDYSKKQRASMCGACKLGSVFDVLEDLPSVTPMPKMGQWFVDERPESNREIICSNCEKPVFRYHKIDFDYRPNYCPNCGAKM